MMKRGVIAILLFATICQATIVTIEADDFTAGTNISSAFQDITLYEDVGSELSPYIYATPSTHSLGLLGDNCIGWWPTSSGEWWGNSPQLRLDFNGLAKSIYVTALGREGWVQQTFIVKGFTASDEQIGYLFKTTSSVQTRWILMEFSDYQMAYATIYANMPVAFDNIIVDFEPVPEPATVLLLGFGVLAIRRRV